MKKYLPLLVLISLLSCKTQPGSDREYDKFDPNKTYKLQLNPASGSSYYYDITNESAMKMEINDKKIDNESRTSAGIIFGISKDTAGGLLLSMTYDKIHLYTRDGDIENDADAANAAMTLNPMEKMLGVLKNTNLSAAVSHSGEIKYINGYKEMGDKILAGFAPNDINGRTIAKSQWEKQIGNNMIKSNIDQLFKIFPDSAVHLGDSWKLTTRQEAEMGLVIKNTFTLKAINNDIAVIAVTGKISSDEKAANLSGLNGATAHLEGEQEGEFEIETKTGMLINCSIKADVKGNIQALGQDVPISIKTTVKMKGRKL